MLAERHVFLAVLLVVAGCQTASLGEIAPQPAVTAQAPAAEPEPGQAEAAPVVMADAPTPTGPAETGTYPNLNIRPQAEAEQFTDSERNAKIGELTAARQRQGVKSGGGGPANDIARLRRLSQTHGRDALEEIEGE